MRHRHFIITAAMTSAATMIATLDALKRDDLALTRAAVTDDQKEVASAARARSYILRRAIQRWLAAEVRAQRRPLHLDDD
jgi:hypothetical protein